MAIRVEMPKMSDTMEEGVLVAWLVEEGESVSAGDVIAQVETDKATMDLEVYDDGVLLKKAVEEGASVPLGGLIAVLGKAGEDISAVLGGGDGGGDGSTAEPEAPAASAPAAPAMSGDGAAAPAPPAEAADAGRIKASPLARKMAKTDGIDLSAVSGTGTDGRIVKRDILAFAEEQAAIVPAAPAPVEAPAAPAPARPKPQPVSVGDTAVYEATPLSQMRKTITRRLGASKFAAPHFYLTVDVKMEAAFALRKQLNELSAKQDGPKVSFNDLITKACALALRQHPIVNASYMEAESEIRTYSNVNVAIAVAVDEGLVTPVVRNADQKGLATIAKETRELAGKARDKRLQPSDYEGSTFTTSNLGMFGIEEFTAIINPPNACILAIGAIRDTPVVDDGEIVPGKRMKITLSCDHRIVDGAVGAQFLGTVQRYLEDPLNLML
ncbi:MAG: pyruvate dehydrogenase complex dihydrolipoamide acetyltransferase [Bacteroidota bacterium]